MNKPNFVLVVPQETINQPVQPPTRDEWYGIAKKLHPQMQREEFDTLWKQFDQVFQPETQQA